MKTATLQQDHESESEEEEKVTTAGFTQGRPIDLGSNSDDERKIAALGIAVDGPIDLGSNLGNEKKVSIGIAPKEKRTPNVAWLQELEEINQIIQV